tara:strand:- start:1189 stop:3390 length:2202 start_codon:yes stop_codon:yes gene_type:complete
MAGEKNFNIKNGLSVAGVEVINSSGDLVAGGVGTAVQEAIADKIGGILSATGGATATYNDGADTIVIDVPILDADDMSGASATTISSSESVKAYVDSQILTKDNTDEITEGSSNLYFTNARADARITNALKDEDNMASNSATHIPSQQSVKAYVDSQILTKDNTDEITEGSTNLYFTNARADARIAAADTGDLSEGTNLYFTNTRADARITNALVDEDNMASNSDVKIPSQQSVKAYVDAQVASKDALSELSGDTDDITEGSANLYYTDARAQAVSINNVVEDTTPQLGGNLDAQSFNITTTGKMLYSNVYSVEGDLPSASTYHGMFAHVHGTGKGYYAHGGNWIKLLDETSSTTANLTENTNLYYTDERVDDRVNALLQAGTNITTSYDDANGTLTINSSGKTEEEIEDIVNGLVVGGTGITSTYDDAAGTLTLTNDITQYTDALSRAAISVTDSGGDGSLAYNNSTGVITYNGPSASEVRAHITAGTGVGFSGGAISIGQAVATTSDVTFADIAATDLTLSGNLTVNGTTTTASSTNTVIADTLIELGNGTSGTPANDSGFVIERGSSDNAFIGFDESADKFTMGTGSFTGASTGNLTIATGTLVANLEGNVTGNVSGTVSGNAGSATILANARSIALGGDVSGSANFDGSANITITATVADDSHNHTIANVDGLQAALDLKYDSGDNIAAGTITTTNASNNGGFVRNVYQSTSAPGSSDGAVGDLWILYS